jgi:hypothetical protein
MQLIFSALYAILSDSVFLLFELMLSHFKLCFKFDSLVVDQRSRKLLGYEQHSKLNHTIGNELRINMQGHGWNIFVLFLVIQYCGDTCCFFFAVLSQKQNT